MLSGESPDGLERCRAAEERAEQLQVEVGEEAAAVSAFMRGLRTLHSFDVVDLATVPEGFREQALSRAVRVL